MKKNLLVLSFALTLITSPLSAEEPEHKIETEIIGSFCTSDSYKHFLKIYKSKDSNPEKEDLYKEKSRRISSEFCDSESKYGMPIESLRGLYQFWVRGQQGKN